MRALPPSGIDRPSDATRSFWNLFAAAEVAVVEVVLEIEPDRGVAALAQTEAEAEPGVAAEVGPALVVVEGFLPRVNSAGPAAM